MDAIGIIILISALFLGWIADLVFGDPVGLPHPVVGFGKIIAGGEKRFNKNSNKTIKGVSFAFTLILLSFVCMYFVLEVFNAIHPFLKVALSAIVIFYCLAGTTLIKEVKQVFVAVDTSTEAGRTQVARIVGRDTSDLSPQQIRTAALETLSENLSDGVVAPLFWYMLLGVPGMFAYKMINTLDSMIGYKNERYNQFGCFAARIDDVANYIPARLTALLMVIVSGRLSLISFVNQYGHRHASPNSGYPEAVLAGILNCRFGGPTVYFGQTVDKPYIGYNNRALTTSDMEKAVRINRKVEIGMLMVVILCTITFKIVIE